MAQNFQAVLNALRVFADAKLVECDNEADRHRLWLKETVQKTKLGLEAPDASTLRFLPSAKKPARSTTDLCKFSKENMAPSTEKGTCLVAKYPSPHAANTTTEATATPATTTNDKALTPSTNPLAEKVKSPTPKRALDLQPSSPLTVESGLAPEASESATEASEDCPGDEEEVKKRPTRGRKGKGMSTAAEATPAPARPTRTSRATRGTTRKAEPPPSSPPAQAEVPHKRVRRGTSMLPDSAALPSPLPAPTQEGHAAAARTPKIADASPLASSPQPLPKSQQPQSHPRTDSDAPIHDASLTDLRGNDESVGAAAAATTSPSHHPGADVACPSRATNPAADAVNRRARSPSVGDDQDSPPVLEEEVAPQGMAVDPSLVTSNPLFVQAGMSPLAPSVCSNNDNAVRSSPSANDPSPAPPASVTVADKPGATARTDRSVVAASLPLTASPSVLEGAQPPQRNTSFTREDDAGTGGTDAKAPGPAAAALKAALGSAARRSAEQKPAPAPALRKSLRIAGAAPGSEQDAQAAAQQATDEGDVSAAASPKASDGVYGTGGQETSKASPRNSEDLEEVDAPSEEKAAVGTIRSALAGVASFLSFVPKPQAAAPIAAGKRVGKVKALEAAEAARKAEEAKQAEKAARKQALLQNKQAQPAEGSQKPKPASFAPSAASSQRPSNLTASAQPASSASTTHGEESAVMRLKRAHEARARIAEENRRKLETERRKKEEEKQKRELELEERRKARDAKELKEKERRMEELRKNRTNQEERQKAAQEDKERMRKMLEDAERERKKAEEESKRRRKLERAQESEPRQDDAGKRQKLMDETRAKNIAAMPATVSAGMMSPPPSKHKGVGVASPLQPAVRTPTSLHAPGGKRLSPAASSAARGTPGTSKHSKKANASQADAHKGFRSDFETMPPPPPRDPTPVKSRVRPPPAPSPAGIKSITIAEYRSDSDSDEEECKPKQMAVWAERGILRTMLEHQADMDPDEIFNGESRTCRLEEVFESRKPAKSDRQRDLSRRNSSGNWTKDQLTWREEMKYKMEMKYIQ